jgi:hypothetical protein
VGELGVRQNMKNLYRSIFAFCIILLLARSLVDIAIPSYVYFAHCLSKYPDKWELKLKESGPDVFMYDSGEGKKHLLTFINQNLNSYTKRFDWLDSAFCVAIIFSIIGWIREKRIERKNAEQGAALQRLSGRVV